LPINRKEGTRSKLMINASQQTRKSTKDSPAARETLDLLILIGWTRDMIRKVRQKELAPYGLNPDKAAVLQVIQNLGGSAKANDIAREILRERHSAHELLRRMEKSGLLKETGDIHRKNGVVFELTNKGREAYHHVVKRPLQHKIFSSLSNEQREELVASLHTIYDRARKIVDESRTSSINRQPSSEN
jgi:DNA-binding MarR family transcriptional regulator